MATIQTSVSRENHMLYLSLKKLADEVDLEELIFDIVVDTSIKCLDLRDFCEADVEKYQPLFQGISQSKSITYIKFHDCDVCKELSGAIFGNANVSSLRFEHCNIRVDIFALALQTKKQLDYVFIDGCTFMENENDKPTKRAKIESCEKEAHMEVFGYDVHVKELHFQDKRVNSEQNLIRFASALPNISLRKLDISHVRIDANIARALSYGISQNKTIEILVLANFVATEDATNVMISCLDWTSSIKTLELMDELNGHITDNAMISLAVALANDSSLEELEINNCYEVTSIGWLELSRALGSSRSSLKKLCVWNTSIDDSIITAFGDDLSRNTSLEVLDITCDDVPPITSESWLAFSRLFGSNLSNLREIDVSDNRIDSDVIIAFINELRGNENLLLKRFIIRSKEDLGIDSPIDPTNDIWDPVMNLLCNTSSIDATWASNHTLCNLGGFVVEEPDLDSDDDERFTMPQEIYDLLEMNENDDKKQVARRKVMKYHFSGDFDLNALIGSDQKLLPHKMSWFGRDALGQSIVYSILRKLPDLCQN